MIIEHIIPKIHITNNKRAFPTEVGVWFYSPREDYNRLLYNHIISCYEKGFFIGERTELISSNIRLDDFRLSEDDIQILLDRKINVFRLDRMDRPVLWGQYFVDTNGIVKQVSEYIAVYNFFKYLSSVSKETSSSSQEDVIANKLQILYSFEENYVHFRFCKRTEIYIIRLDVISDYYSFYKSVSISEQITSSENRKTKQIRWLLDNNKLTVFLSNLIKAYGHGIIASQVNRVLQGQVDQVSDHIIDYATQLAKMLIE